MADLLVQSGKISASRWTQILRAEIEAAKRARGADDFETFFRAALAALEQALAESGDIAGAELAERQSQWERAY